MKATLTNLDIENVAKQLQCPIAAIRAVDEVESGGKGFYDDGRLIIRFEPHIFWKELKKVGIDPVPLQAKYTTANILQPTWSDKNYKGFTSWQKLQVAKNIHTEAALKSASYGRYQVLGQNHKMVGFDTANALFNFLDQSEANQLTVFMRFIRAAGLQDELQHLDWAGFARGYNGPLYTRNNYDGKLKFAYLKYNTKVVVKNIVAAIKPAT